MGTLSRLPSRPAHAGQLPTFRRLGLLAVAPVLLASMMTVRAAEPARAKPTAFANRNGALVVTNGLAGTITAYPTGSSGNAAPSRELSLGPDVPNSIAFDPSGNLWVANFGAHTVAEYRGDDLAGGARGPAVTITSDRSYSLNSPAGLAIDAAGDIWVANDLSNTVVEYARGSLTSGPVVPLVTISSDHSSSLSGPYALAFDSSGDLWVANYDNSTLVKYPRDRLVSGNRAPAVTISADSSGSLNSPAGLAFDAAGDLWVAANLSNKVLEYTHRQLVSGRPRPEVTISANARGSLNSPEGLAFDRAGNLWVANYGNNSVAEFPPSELSASGRWPPVVIAGPGTGLLSPGAVAIDPTLSMPAKGDPRRSHGDCGGCRLST